MPVEDRTSAADTGLARYFRFTLDHKVVGIQYLVGMIIYFCTAGLFAMAIRTELLSPTYHVFSSQAYVEIVGEHGTMMMMLMTSVILGPFGNYLVPLMIGSKRVAFPRIEALSFWITPAAFLVLLSGLLLGGFPFGWTGYAPLSIQSTVGADSYAIAFGLMGISMILAAFNIIVTVICYRAPGMRWSRLPMFVWSMVATSFLMVLAAPGAGRRHVHDDHRPDGADRVLRRLSSAAAATCTRTCSGSSAIPRCTSWPCPASASCRRSCRCSAASRCSATRSPRPG